MIIHTVKSGDTAFSIAQTYGVSVESVITNNGIASIADRLPVGLGLVILIPDIIHKVGPFDTVGSVATFYGVSRNQIFRNNLSLAGLDALVPGTEIVISYDAAPVFDFDIGGYSYTNVRDDVLNTVLPAMKLFVPFTYGFTPDGEIILLSDERLLSRARNYGVRTAFHLSTLTESMGFSNELAHTILASPSVWNVLADNIISVMNSKGMTVLDVDFEYLFASEREIYPRFISFLREKVAEQGYSLIVAVPPKTSSDQKGDLYEGIDYGLLAEAADYILIMTYEWGYSYGPPLPVSPTPSIRRVLDYAITEIPAEKIYMGISNYGYDWRLPYIRGESRAQSLSNIEAAQIASDNRAEIMYNSEYEAPYFFYTSEDGSVHEVWFEDARSIYAKLLLIKQYGFRGGLYWNLTRPNPQNSALLSATMEYDN